MRRCRCHRRRLVELIVGGDLLRREGTVVETEGAILALGAILRSAVVDAKVPLVRHEIAVRLAARGGGRKYCAALRVDDRVCRANDSRKGLLVPAVDDRARGEAEPGGGAVQFPLELSGGVEEDAAVVVGVVVGDGDEVGVVGVGLARPVADGLDCYAFGAGDVAACLDVGLGAVEIEARVRPVPLVWM